jgi:hypothetical protein
MSNSLFTGEFYGDGCDPHRVPVSQSAGCCAARLARRHLQRPSQSLRRKIGFDRGIERARNHLVGDKPAKPLACRRCDGRAALLAPFHAKGFRSRAISVGEAPAKDDSAIGSG